VAHKWNASSKSLPVFCPVTGLSIVFHVLGVGEWKKSECKTQGAAMGCAKAAHFKNEWFQ